MHSVPRFCQFAAGFLLFVVWAVATGAQAPGVTAPPPSSGFGAHGITAVISGITAIYAPAADVKIQLLLKNETSKNIALAVISGDIATASTSTGVQLFMHDASGLPYCRVDGFTQIAGCIKQISPETFIEVDAGQATVTLLHYTGTGSEGQASGSISFTLRLLMRELDKSDDALSSQASVKTGGEPRVIVINFPLVPLGTGN